MLLSKMDIIYRLATILVLSGLIGVEREYRAKPAGVRTNIMVGLGSTIMTMAGLQAMHLFPGTSVDPTRIAAQIITGIGFIGAGAILRPMSAKNSNVVGLTTAATLWVVSGLGIAVGFGLYFEAAITTALVFFTFSVLGRVVSLVRKRARAFPSDIQAHEEADEKKMNHDNEDPSGKED